MKVKNVVLVHGAFADGSGWKGIYEILTKKGYNVTIVQNPLSSLEDDVAATNLALDAAGWTYYPRRSFLGWCCDYTSWCTP